MNEIDCTVQYSCFLPFDCSYISQKLDTCILNLSWWSDKSSWLICFQHEVDHCGKLPIFNDSVWDWSLFYISQNKGFFFLFSLNLAVLWLLCPFSSLLLLILMYIPPQKMHKHIQQISMCVYPPSPHTHSKKITASAAVWVWHSSASSLQLSKTV